MLKSNKLRPILKKILQSCPYKQDVSTFYSCYSPMQGIFFYSRFLRNFASPTIFSFLRVVRPWFFYWRVAFSSESVLNTYNVSPRCFFTTLRRFEVKVLVKNCQKWEIVTSSKLLFYSRFLRNFHFSYDIFISTCRTSLIFLSTYSLEFRECFEYL